ncbi:MAG: 2-phosphosulfolactate phosphatase [Bacteroidales bacterium]|nr:2-phosphosulfolactate phosphatase [Bacteroidales bacterium]
MQIEILEFVEGAKKARGLAVIIDVFRAFSVACYIIDGGAARLIVTGTPEQAFKIKGKYRNSILAGERNEKKIEGFDLGNSPTEIIKTPLEGKTVILTTTAGTQGLINAVNADSIITGSLVNATAVAQFIKHLNPAHLSLVAMGYRAEISAEEDLICARFIADRLRGKNTSFDEQISDLRKGSGKRFFLKENIDFSPPTDFFLCTMADRFDFVLQAEKMSEGIYCLSKKEI